MFMHSLGISVYPDKSDIKEVYEYMETAAKLGFSRIFTCFLSTFSFLKANTPTMPHIYIVSLAVWEKSR